MKILMICTEKLPVPPIRGGAIQTYIAGCLPHLKNNHQITILGTNDPSLPDQEMVDGVRYIRVPGKILDVYRAGIVQYLQQESFDLIHIFNRPKLVLPVRSAASNAKITLSMHNDMFNLDKIDPTEASAALDEVSQIVTVSDYVGNVIKELYPKASHKIRTIYSGVDTERFLPASHPKMQKIRTDLRREHDLENKTVILFVGRLSKNKGVDRLIRALPQIANKHKDVALVIVGSNWFSENAVTDYVAYVRALSKRLPVPVVTTGFVKPDEIQNWFAAADLFVCSSLWPEPLARVHYEAMAAGLPIVTTARGGNPEVIQLSDCGHVVEEPENPDQFAEVISGILANKGVMKQMGKRGREIALAHYRWDRVGSQVLQAWEDAEKIVSEVATEAVSEETVKHVEAVSEKTVNHVEEIAQPIESEASPAMEKEEVSEQPVLIEATDAITNDNQQSEIEVVDEIKEISVPKEIKEIDEMEKESDHIESYVEEIARDIYGRKPKVFFGLSGEEFEQEMMIMTKRKPRSSREWIFEWESDWENEKLEMDIEMEWEYESKYIPELPDVDFQIERTGRKRGRRRRKSWG